MTADTVSGRVYTSTRVRGFAPWNPRQDTLALISRVQGILVTYQAQLPLTNRQIFYILVGSDEGYPKTENAYARLCEYLNRARRAGMIDFSAIRDDGTQSRGFPGWNSPDGFHADDDLPARSAVGEPHQAPAGNRKLFTSVASSRADCIPAGVSR